MIIKRFKDFLKESQFSILNDPLIGTEKGTKKDFNRTEFYYEYYKNLTPPDFDIRMKGETIIILVNQNN
jgi:hypothetical protein